MKTIKLARLQSKEEQTKPLSTLGSFVNLKKKHINWNQSQILQPQSQSFLEKQHQIVYDKDGLKVKGISQSQRIVFSKNPTLQANKNREKYVKRSTLKQEEPSNPEDHSHNQSLSILSYKAGKRLKTFSLSHDINKQRRNSMKDNIAIVNNSKNDAYSKLRQFKVRKGIGYKLLELVGSGYMNKSLQNSKLNESRLKIMEK